MKVGDKVNQIPNVCPEEEQQRLKYQFSTKKGGEYKPGKNEKTMPDEGVIEGVLQNLGLTGKPRTQYYVRVFLDKDKGSSRGRLRLVDAEKLELIKAA